MDIKEEYHDPDYAGTSEVAKNEPQNEKDDAKIDKIKNIIRKEFANELEARESEIMHIDQRLSSTRKLLHRLRYTLVNNYYADSKLQLTNSHIQDEVAAQSDLKTRSEVSTLLRDGQKRLHPSVRKLLGKKTVNLEEIFKSREPRQKTRKDYSAMLNTRNYTIAADATTSLRPGGGQLDTTPTPTPAPAPPLKIPRHRDPEVQNVVTVDDITRNKTKHRYRIIIGNTSKYSPASSAADPSTHQWLLYIRGRGAAVIRHVAVTLHRSYTPHHVLHCSKPPFQVSRRGWGEFPARVELNFMLPDRNRPATVEHTIKLDRLHTGLQTLGAETVVDVWLYSTPEMLQHQHIEENEKLVQPKIEPMANEPSDMGLERDSAVQNDSWLEFFSKDTTELDVDEMIIKPVKSNGDGVSEILSKDIKQEVCDSASPDTDLSFNCDVDIKCEPAWDSKCQFDNEAMPDELITSTSPKKKIMKYMDPTTGKIYYLEMDRNLDLSKVQEIVINSKGHVKTAKISPIKSNTNGLKSVRKLPKKTGVSLLKPEVKSLLKTESPVKSETPKLPPAVTASYLHLENDHCYLGQNWLTSNSTLPSKSESVHSDKIKSENSVANILTIKEEVSLYDRLVSVMPRFSNSRTAVSYLLKKIPLTSNEIGDPEFAKHFPFVVENEEKYWKLDFAKRRNIEWSRAKMINRLLQNHLQSDQIWRTKQILVFSRYHGFYPLRPEACNINTDYWDVDKQASTQTKLQNFSTLTLFDKESFTENLSDTVDLCESDDEIDVVGEGTVKVEKIKRDEKVFEVLEASEEERLRFLYIERKCADISIELRNEDVGSGYSYSAVHAVLLSAFRSHAESLIRSALANKLLEDYGQNSVWVGSSSSVPRLCIQHTGTDLATSARDLAAAPAGARGPL